VKRRALGVVVVDKDDCAPVGLDTYECGGVVYGGLWPLH
jgi:hypothetical protein